MSDNELEHKYDGFHQDLNADEERLQASLARLDEERAVVLSSLGRLRAVRATLKGEAVPRRSAARAPRNGNGYTKHELTALVEDVLRKQGPMAEPELRERLLAHAKANARIATGLHVVLGYTLKDARFLQADGRYVLAEDDSGQITPGTGTNPTAELDVF